MTHEQASSDRRARSSPVKPVMDVRGKTEGLVNQADHPDIRTQPLPLTYIREIGLGNTFLFTRICIQFVRTAYTPASRWKRRWGAKGRCAPPQAQLKITIWCEYHDRLFASRGIGRPHSGPTRMARPPVGPRREPEARTGHIPPPGSMPRRASSRSTGACRPPNGSTTPPRRSASTAAVAAAASARPGPGPAPGHPSWRPAGCH